MKYYRYLDDPKKISDSPTTIKDGVLKALIALSKYLGCYTESTASFKNHGIKWNHENSLKAFLNIINNNHVDLNSWYKSANNVLRTNGKLYLRYALLSGLRKQEAIDSFNMVTDLSKSGKLDEYYDENTSCLQHFKYGKYLRKSKSTYITAIFKDLVKSLILILLAILRSVRD